MKLRRAEAAAAEARPAGRGRAEVSREERRAPRRRRRPGRTGGLAAPPPHGGLPAPRGPLRREPHTSRPSGLGVPADSAGHARGPARGWPARPPAGAPAEVTPPPHGQRRTSLTLPRGRRGGCSLPRRPGEWTGERPPVFRIPGDCPASGPTAWEDSVR